MIDEARRRACLQAMQVDVWLPRTALPHAAPSRPAQLAAVAVPVLANALPEARPVRPAVPAVTVPRRVPGASPAVVSPRERLAEVLPIRPDKLESRQSTATVVAAPAQPVKPAAAASNEPVPRFSLQFLQAGRCLLVLQLPTGETPGQRDPESQLLGDLLRAAGLPAPRELDAPLRWPVLRAVGNQVDLGPQGAREYVNTLLQCHVSSRDPLAIWLIGEAARRYSGLDDPAQAPGACFVWQLPGLDQLIEQPGLKPGLWQDMQRVMARWTVNND